MHGGIDSVGDYYVDAVHAIFIQNLDMLLKERL